MTGPTVWDFPSSEAPHLPAWIQHDEVHQHHQSNGSGARRGGHQRAPEQHGQRSMAKCDGLAALIAEYAPLELQTGNAPVRPSALPSRHLHPPRHRHSVQLPQHSNARATSPPRSSVPAAHSGGARHWQLQASAPEDLALKIRRQSDAYRARRDEQQAALKRQLQAEFAGPLPPQPQQAVAGTPVLVQTVKPRRVSAPAGLQGASKSSRPPPNGPAPAANEVTPESAPQAQHGNQPYPRPWRQNMRKPQQPAAAEEGSAARGEGATGSPAAAVATDAGTPGASSNPEGQVGLTRRAQTLAAEDYAKLQEFIKRKRVEVSQKLEREREEAWQATQRRLAAVQAASEMSRQAARVAASSPPRPQSPRPAWVDLIPPPADAEDADPSTEQAAAAQPAANGVTAKAAQPAKKPPQRSTRPQQQHQTAQRPQSPSWTPSQSVDAGPPALLPAAQLVQSSRANVPLPTHSAPGSYPDKHKLKPGSKGVHVATRGPHARPASAAASRASLSPARVRRASLSPPRSRPLRGLPPAASKASKRKNKHGTTSPRKQQRPALRPATGEERRPSPPPPAARSCSPARVDMQISAVTLQNLELLNRMALQLQHSVAAGLSTSRELCTSPGSPASSYVLPSPAGILPLAGPVLQPAVHGSPPAARAAVQGSPASPPPGCKQLLQQLPLVAPGRADVMDSWNEDEFVFSQLNQPAQQQADKAGAPSSLEEGGMQPEAPVPQLSLLPAAGAPAPAAGAAACAQVEGTSGLATSPPQLPAGEQHGDAAAPVQDAALQLLQHLSRKAGSTQADSLQDRSISSFPASHTDVREPGVVHVGMDAVQAAEAARTAAAAAAHAAAAAASVLAYIPKLLPQQPQEGFALAEGPARTVAVLHCHDQVIANPPDLSSAYMVPSLKPGAGYSEKEHQELPQTARQHSADFRITACYDNDESLEGQTGCIVHDSTARIAAKEMVHDACSPSGDVPDWFEDGSSFRYNLEAEHTAATGITASAAAYAAEQPPMYHPSDAAQVERSFLSAATYKLPNTQEASQFLAPPAVGDALSFINILAVQSMPKQVADAAVPETRLRPGTSNTVWLPSGDAVVIMGKPGSAPSCKVQIKESDAAGPPPATEAEVEACSVLEEYMEDLANAAADLVLKPGQPRVESPPPRRSPSALESALKEGLHALDELGTYEVELVMMEQARRINAVQQEAAAVARMLDRHMAEQQQAAHVRSVMQQQEAGMHHALQQVKDQLREGGQMQLMDLAAMIVAQPPPPAVQDAAQQCEDGTQAASSDCKAPGATSSAGQTSASFADVDASNHTSSADTIAANSRSGDHTTMGSAKSHSSDAPDSSFVTTSTTMVPSVRSSEVAATTSLSSTIDEEHRSMLQASSINQSERAPHSVQEALHSDDDATSTASIEDEAELASGSASEVDDTPYTADFAASKTTTTSSPAEQGVVQSNQDLASLQDVTEPEGSSISDDVQSVDVVEDTAITTSVTEVYSRDESHTLQTLQSEVPSVQDEDEEARHDRGNMGSAAWQPASTSSTADIAEDSGGLEEGREGSTSTRSSMSLLSMELEEQRQQLATMLAAKQKQLKLAQRQAALDAKRRAIEEMQAQIDELDRKLACAANDTAPKKDMHDQGSYYSQSTEQRSRQSFGEQDTVSIVMDETINLQDGDHSSDISEEMEHSRSSCRDALHTGSSGSAAEIPLRSVQGSRPSASEEDDEASARIRWLQAEVARKRALVKKLQLQAEEAVLQKELQALNAQVEQSYKMINSQPMVRQPRPANNTMQTTAKQVPSASDTYTDEFSKVASSSAAESLEEDAGTMQRIRLELCTSALASTVHEHTSSIAVERGMPGTAADATSSGASSANTEPAALDAAKAHSDASSASSEADCSVSLEASQEADSGSIHHRGASSASSEVDYSVSSQGSQEAVGSSHHASASTSKSLQTQELKAHSTVSSVSGAASTVHSEDGNEDSYPEQQQLAAAVPEASTAVSEVPEHDVASSSPGASATSYYQPSSPATADDDEVKEEEEEPELEEEKDQAAAHASDSAQGLSIAASAAATSVYSSDTRLSLTEDVSGTVQPASASTALAVDSPRASSSTGTEDVAEEASMDSSLAGLDVEYSVEEVASAEVEVEEGAVYAGVRSQAGVTTAEDAYSDEFSEASSSSSPAAGVQLRFVPDEAASDDESTGSHAAQQLEINNTEDRSAVMAIADGDAKWSLEGGAQVLGSSITSKPSLDTAAGEAASEDPNLSDTIYTLADDVAALEAESIQQQAAAFHADELGPADDGSADDESAYSLDEIPSAIDDMDGHDSDDDAASQMASVMEPDAPSAVGGEHGDAGLYMAPVVEDGIAAATGIPTAGLTEYATGVASTKAILSRDAHIAHGEQATWPPADVASSSVPTSNTEQPGMLPAERSATSDGDRQAGSDAASAQDGGALLPEASKDSVLMPTAEQSLVSIADKAPASLASSFSYELAAEFIHTNEASAAAAADLPTPSNSDEASPSQRAAVAGPTKDRCAEDAASSASSAATPERAHAGTDQPQAEPRTHSKSPRSWSSSEYSVEDDFEEPQTVGDEELLNVAELVAAGTKPSAEAEQDAQKQLGSESSSSSRASSQGAGPVADLLQAVDSAADLPEVESFLQQIDFEVRNVMDESCVGPAESRVLPQESQQFDSLLSSGEEDAASSDAAPAAEAKNSADAEEEAYAGDHSAALGPEAAAAAARHHDDAAALGAVVEPVGDEADLCTEDCASPPAQSLATFERAASGEAWEPQACADSNTAALATAEQQQEREAGAIADELFDHLLTDALEVMTSLAHSGQGSGPAAAVQTAASQAMEPADTGLQLASSSSSSSSDADSAAKGPPGDRAAQLISCDEDAAASSEDLEELSEDAVGVDLPSVSLSSDDFGAMEIEMSSSSLSSGEELFDPSAYVIPEMQSPAPAPKPVLPMVDTSTASIAAYVGSIMDSFLAAAPASLLPGQDPLCLDGYLALERARPAVSDTQHIFNKLIFDASNEALLHLYSKAHRVQVAACAPDGVRPLPGNQAMRDAVQKQVLAWATFQVKAEADLDRLMLSDVAADEQSWAAYHEEEQLVMQSLTNSIWDDLVADTAFTLEDLTWALASVQPA